MNFDKVWLFLRPKISKQLQIILTDCWLLLSVKGNRNGGDFNYPFCHTLRILIFHFIFMLLLSYCSICSHLCYMLLSLVFLIVSVYVTVCSFIILNSSIMLTFHLYKSSVATAMLPTKLLIKFL